MTRDGHDAYSRAIRGTLSRRVMHRRHRYFTNRVEQDYRGITQRTQRCYPMRGIGSFEGAARF